MKKYTFPPIFPLVIAITTTCALLWLSFAGQARLAAPTTRQQLNRNGHSMSSREFLRLEAIDLNKAGAEDLQEISGIGPELAKRIIAYRKKQGGIFKITDLDEVNGIGPATLRKIIECGYVVP